MNIDSSFNAKKEKEMIHQCKQNYKNYYRGLTCRMIPSVVALLLFCGTFLPILASPGELQYRRGGNGSSITGDTTKTTNGTLPLVQNPDGLSRPRFESVHLIVGIGGMNSNFSDLERLGIDKSNFSIPLSIYTYIPFQRDNPSFYFVGGYDIGIGDKSYPAFKALLLHQIKYRLSVGVGAGRTGFSQRGNVNIEAHQTQAQLAFGVNLSPQRIDLLLTIPVAPSLSTRFEEVEYSIRPAGVQLSLFVSLR